MTNTLEKSTSILNSYSSSLSQLPTNANETVFDYGCVPDFVDRPNPSIYRYGSYVVLDFETTNTDFGNPLDPANRVITGHWTVDGKEWKNWHEHGYDALACDLDDCDFLVCHNTKFELGWLKRLGYTTPLLTYDTYLAEFVYAGNRKWALDLDSVAERWTGKKKQDEVSALLEAGVCLSTVPIALVDSYCRNDVVITEETFLKQVEKLDELGLLPSVYTRCLLTPVLVALESRGMALDRQVVKEYFTQYNGNLNELREQLNALTGGINLNSPKQLAGYLYDTLGFAETTKPNGSPDRTDADGRRTDSETIGRLRIHTEGQRRFVELFADYGSLKVNTAALEKMWKCCLDTPLDKVPILYARYNQAVAQTHRLTSSGAKYKLQFHNFNRSFKRLFCSRFGSWFVGEGDGAQLEFRVAVHLGRDTVGARDIRDPTFDAHYQTAEILLKKVRNEINKVERQDAKPLTFKPLYGGQSGTKSQRAYYKFFQNKYGGIYKAQTGWTYTVARDKELVTETGLRFYWPDCTVGSDGYVKYKTSIFNYPVQSLATADIIPIGLVYCYYRMLSLGLHSFLVNTIHDSIIGEIHPDEDAIFRGLVEKSLTGDTFSYLWRCYGIRFSVPLGCESKVGTHWGTGPDKKFDLDPELFPELFYE